MDSIDVEGVLMTGGESRRMGQDKATLEVEGQTLAARIIQQMNAARCQVTVLGREPLDGARFIPDLVEYAGPLVSLHGFTPEKSFVFLASCDLVRFDGRLIECFWSLMDDFDAVIPYIDGFDQPLCGLYRSYCFEGLSENPQLNRMRDWLELLNYRRVDDTMLMALGFDSDVVRSVNTMSEFEKFKQKTSRS